jgi:hypothetical protein
LYYLYFLIIDTVDYYFNSCAVFGSPAMICEDSEQATNGDEVNKNEHRD